MYLDCSVCNFNSHRQTNELNLKLKFYCRQPLQREREAKAYFHHIGQLHKKKANKFDCLLLWCFGQQKRKNTYMLSTYKTIQNSFLLSQWKSLKKLALELGFHFVWLGDLRPANMFIF